MKKIDVKKLVIAALLASFTSVATMIIQIPNGIGGYINLGDCIVIISGWMLGPVYGGISAAIGSMLADIFSSYVIYAPATFVIKGAMAVIATLLYKSLTSKRFVAAAVSGVCAELFMVFGYFMFEGLFLYGFGTAALGLVSNFLQAIFGVVCALIIKQFIEKKGISKI